jgi:hypothetical protein
VFLGSFLPSHPSTISLTANRLTLLLFFAIVSPPYEYLLITLLILVICMNHAGKTCMQSHSF